MTNNHIILQMINMAAAMLTKFAFCLIFVSLSYCSKVPLVAWSYGNRHLTTPEHIVKGQSVAVDKVFQKYLKPYVESGGKLVVFLYDQLSVDDFTIHQSSFTNLKFVLSRQQSFLLPSVSSDDKTIYDSIKSAGQTEEVFSSDIASWSFKKDANDAQVILFHLEPTSGASAEGRKEILLRNDKEIKRILKTIDLDSFAAVLTSSQPSEIVENLFLKEQILSEENSPKRHLLSTDDEIKPNVTFFNNKELVYMYAKEIIFEGTSLANKTFKSNGVCSDNQICLNLELLTAKDNITDFQLTIMLNQTHDEWYCKEIHVKATVDSKSIDQNFECGESPASMHNDKNSVIRAPIHMSYSCHEMSFAAKNTSLQINGMQLQLRPSDHRFGNAYSCIGFFTIEILTGIFVTIILALGLLFGIGMMMAIQSPDRFDDPKGATISVPDRE